MIILYSIDCFDLWIFSDYPTIYLTPTDKASIDFRALNYAISHSDPKGLKYLKLIQWLRVLPGYPIHETARLRHLNARGGTWPLVKLFKSGYTAWRFSAYFKFSLCTCTPQRTATPRDSLCAILKQFLGLAGLVPACTIVCVLVFPPCSNSYSLVMLLSTIQFYSCISLSLVSILLEWTRVSPRSWHSKFPHMAVKTHNKQTQPS